MRESNPLLKAHEARDLTACPICRLFVSPVIVTPAGQRDIATALFADRFPGTLSFSVSIRKSHIIRVRPGIWRHREGTILRPTA